MASSLQEPINVLAGENIRRPRIGGPPNHRDVRWLSPWWRTWDARQHTFAHHAYDPCDLLKDTIHKAATDFQEERPWPRAEKKMAHSSWRLWEQFRIAIGLSYRPVLFRLARDDFNEEHGDDSSDEEDPPPREPHTAPSTGPKKHRVFRGVGAFYEEEDDKAAERGMTPNEQWLRHTAEMGENMARFTLDAEKVMKFLFSAYFYHHKLIATPEACDNMPVIAWYFLRSLLRHIELDSHDKAMFERALAVTELARVQLPHINRCVKGYTIARDNFSIFCRVTFGDELPVPTPLTTVFSNTSLSSLATDDSGADSSASESATSLPQTPARDEHTALPSVDTTSPLVSDENERVWLSRSGVSVVLPRSDPWTLQKPDLPLPDLSLTHVRGLVEASVRRIVGVFPPANEPPVSSTPASTVERALVQNLWSVKLAPQPGFRSWHTPDWEVWEGYESATLRVRVEGRDSRDAPMRLLVSSSVGMALARCPGMLLCGDFAELAPRMGGKGAVWYLHQFVGLAPSFYEPDRPELDDSAPRALGEPSFADLLSTA
ncbi:hypothetical protein PENSPDRAFT_653912 [Peniophora sp. CONT]|nr:hypothetical protein PENSPDRAFT_653912 [Peniophora sp. CONT]